MRLYKKWHLFLSQDIAELTKTSLNSISNVLLILTQNLLNYQPPL